MSQQKLMPHVSQPNKQPLLSHLQLHRCLKCLNPFEISHTTTPSNIPVPMETLETSVPNGDNCPKTNLPLATSPSHVVQKSQREKTKATIVTIVTSQKL